MVVQPVPLREREPDLPREPRLPAPACRVRRAAWHHEGGLRQGIRSIPEETAIALTYNRITHAVMMATPSDLEDFAIGFSLAEGIISSPRDIETLEVVDTGDGIELRMWIAAACGDAYTDRRRHIAGPTGCGLCGVESLAEAVRPPRAVTSALRVSARDIHAAIASLADGQRLNRTTHAVHAAGLWRPGAGLVMLREDVGRHNALDKLAGGLAAAGISAEAGIIALTSRVSVELIQKTAAMDAPIIAAVSAPTALAVRTAEAANITLAAIVREDGFEIFTHPHRIIGRDPD